MRKLTILLISLGVMISSPCLAQYSKKLSKSYDKTYQKRIKKEKLFGVYIPKDLGDAFARLNRLISKESKVKFKRANEGVAIRKLHFSFGRWMIHNWGFYEGSRFSHYLRKLGIYNPDDMARFVMTTYHRNLNRKPLEVKELVEMFQANQAKKKKERLSEGTVISKTTKKRVSPPEKN